MNYNEDELNIFKKNFAPDVIKNYNGLDLLKLLAYPKNPDSNIKEQFKNIYEENYNSLKNELENNMTDFGSGSAGYDTNFVLAYRQGDWYNERRKVSLNEAIQIAEEIKQELIKASTYLDSSDFSSFYNFVSSSSSGLFNKGYIHKYFYILYPQYIIFYHAGTWQQYYKKCLNLPKSQNYYDIEKYFLDKDLNCNVGEKSRELEKKYGTPKNPKINEYKSKYWLYSAGEKSYKWNEFYKDGIMAIGWDYLGDLTKYNSQEDIANKIKQEESRNNEPMNDSKANWEFAKKIQVGDIVYVKKGLQDALIGRGIVKSDYIYDENRNEYKSIRKIEWTHNGTYDVDFKELDIKQWNQKTLTEISQSKYGDFCLKIEDIFMNKANDNNTFNVPLNQILYGPPGTGKTYNTVVKAMEIISSNYVNMKDEKGNFKTDYSSDEYEKLKEEFDNYKNEGRIEFVTFHQSYSYEEFIEGIKPYISEWGSTENTEVKYVGEDGIFKRMCTFKNLWENFKKNHPVPYKMETASDSVSFQITEYREDSFKVDKIGNLIPVKELEKIYELNLKHHFKIQHEIREFVSDSRYSSYCFSILQELNKPYILIIDEINRGDVSKIFGELITLIEEDKRIGNKYQMKVTLPYSKESFGIPNNLYIIGTMNTADRSIALLDTALRRRFNFEEMIPRPELLENKVVEGINLQDLLENINKRITEKYDKDHQIGHSYLMDIETKEHLERAYKNRILPLLNEYFYNDEETVSKVLNCGKSEVENCLVALNKAQCE